MDKIDFLPEIINNIQKLESANGKIIVSDGKFIGPGTSETKNMIKGTTISKTGDQANIQSKFEDSVLGRLKGDLNEEEVDGVVDKYIDKIVDSIFENL